MKKKELYIRKLIPVLLMLLAVSSFAQFPLYRETVFIQCTSEIFVAGGEIRFKAEVLETDTYKPSALSNNLRVELINNEGEIIFQNNYVLEGSRLSSVIQLPEGLSTGWYHLRAYTNWMRNFPESEFSWKSFRIIQPSDLSNQKYRSENDGNQEYNPPNTLLTGRESDNHKPSISFTDDGSFVNVQVENLQLTGNYKLLAHRTYSWYWYKESHTVTDNIEFTVPKSSLPSGIIQFSLLNNANEYLTARLWTDHDPDYARVKLSNLRDNAGLRSQYTAEYQINTLAQYDRDRISVLVMKENPFLALNDYLPGLPGWPAGYHIPASSDSFRAWLMNNTYPENIVNEFFRTSDLPEIPTSSPEGVQLRFLPETQNGILSGRVTNINDGSGVEEVYLGLTILNNGTFHSSVSDKYGYFVFTFPEVTGPIDYIINFIREAKQELKIDIDGLYEDIEYIPPSGPVMFTAEELEYLREQSEILQLKNIYSSGHIDSIQNNDDHELRRSDLEFYGMPDIRVVLDDFVSLSNLREVIYEVVPYVSIRKNGDYNVPVISSDNLYRSPYPSLLLFDGIPVYDFTEILKLPPERFKSIDVINQFYIHGNTFLSGILNIKSVNQDFGGLDLPETSILGTIDFPEIPEEAIISPEYPSQEIIPVLDNILLWRSTLTEDEGRVSFTTGDNPGNYRIMIYGYDDNGNWLWTSEPFTIKAADQ